MTYAVLVSTWPGGMRALTRLVTSMRSMHYPMYVVINDVTRVSHVDRQRLNWLLSYIPGSTIIERVEDGFELGAMQALLDYAPDVEEFVFLQDTFEVKDVSVFERCFKTQGSVSFGPQFHHFAGKWRREPLLALSPLPVVRDKAESIWQENDFPGRYHEVEPLGVTVLFQDFNDWNGKVIEHEGRQTLLLENAALRKYKTTWAGLHGR